MRPGRFQRGVRIDECGVVMVGFDMMKIYL